MKIVAHFILIFEQPLDGRLVPHGLANHFGGGLAIDGEETCVIDLGRRLVTRDDEQVHLTRTELTLLEQLARHPGKLLTQEYLLREVWGPGYGTESNYLRVYVGQLRKKLGDDATRPRLILTEPGIGYRWIAGA